MTHSIPPVSEGAPAVEIHRLTRRFGDLEPVRDLSLSIARGEILGVLGPNGAGKTTTLSILATLIEPSEGDVRIFGHSVRRDAASVRRRVGLAPQQISLYPTLSAEENLHFFGRLHGLRVPQLRTRSDRLLERVGLAGRRGDPVGTFSGGMKRRLNLACALVHEPALVLLDEPTAGVDPQSREHLFELIAELARDGATVIYTSHYIEEVERLCDRIAILDYGELVAVGSHHELLQIVGLGEIIEVEAAGLDLDALSELKGFRGLQTQGDRLRIFVDDAAQALPHFARCLENAASAARLQVYPIDLERVFIHLTGRDLRD